MTPATYAVPVRHHGPRARSKAGIYYVQVWQGPGLPDQYRPAQGTRVVTLEATSDADAYRRLCGLVRPEDNRPIMGRRAIKLFKAGPAPG